MKFATVVLLGILLLGSYASLNAQPAGTSQVVLAFTGGSVYTSDTTGICMWYPVLVGDLPRDRIVDFVRHARRKLSQRGQPVGLQQFLVRRFELLRPVLHLAFQVLRELRSE